MSDQPPIRPGVTSEDDPAIQRANLVYWEKINEAAEELGEVAKQMSTRKFAKNTKNMTGMFKAMGKVNIKAAIIEAFVGALSGVMVIMELITPIMEVLGALIEYTLMPAVIGLMPFIIMLTKAMWDLRDAVRFVSGDVGGLKQSLLFWEAMNDLLIKSGILANGWMTIWDAFIKKIDDAIKVIESFGGIGASGGFAGSDRGRDGGDLLDNIRDVLESVAPQIGAAEGMLVPARAGGTQVTVAEGGEDEIIAPLSQLGTDPELLFYLRTGAEASLELVEMKKRNRRRRRV